MVFFQFILKPSWETRFLIIILPKLVFVSTLLEVLSKWWWTSRKTLFNFNATFHLNIETTEIWYRHKTFYSQNRKQREIFRVIWIYTDDILTHHTLHWHMNLITEYGEITRNVTLTLVSSIFACFFFFYEWNIKLPNLSLTIYSYNLKFKVFTYVFSVILVSELCLEIFAL